MKKVLLGMTVATLLGSVFTADLALARKGQKIDARASDAKLLFTETVNTHMKEKTLLEVKLGNKPVSSVEVSSKNLSTIKDMLSNLTPSQLEIRELVSNLIKGSDKGIITADTAKTIASIKLEPSSEKETLVLDASRIIENLALRKSNGTIEKGSYADAESAFATLLIDAAAGSGRFEKASPEEIKGLIKASKVYLDNKADANVMKLVIETITGSKDDKVNSEKAKEIAERCKKA
ncbi:MAG: hypothetical protein SGJ18_08890 [Pseudomonadota bacterium]|nr:hypothetical protein [Pseudomonadota bacterium]